MYMFVFSILRSAPFHVTYFIYTHLIYITHVVFPYNTSYSNCTFLFNFK